MTPSEHPRGSGPLRAVLDALRTSGPLTRAELGLAAGLSRTTVSGVLSELKRYGLVDDAGDGRPVNGRALTGRPAAAVALSTAAGLVVGVDVGRRHVRVILADVGHRVLGEHVERFAVEERPDQTFDAIAAMLDLVLTRASATRAQVLGVGLGVPAPLDGDGTVGNTDILPGWVGRVPASDLGDRLGLPVRTDNDANLGALAEAVWGAGRGCGDMVYVKAATGIGAGIVHEGKLFRGVSGTAGEIGHTTVVNEGALCPCGNRGCLEIYAGGAALVERLAHAGVRVTGVPELVTRAQLGDLACRRLLADVGDQIGQAVANVVNLVNPERVVLGGELGLADELILATLRARVLRSAVPTATARVSIAPAVLGDRAEALGAVLLVLRETNPLGERLLERVTRQLEPVLTVHS